MPTVEKVARTDAGLASRAAAVRDAAAPPAGQRARPRQRAEHRARWRCSAACSATATLTVGELAALERVQPPSMTRTVNCLEDGGYVARRAARDRRPPGRRRQPDRAGPRRRCSPTARRRDEWLARQLRDLTPEERAVLRAAAPDCLQTTDRSDDRSRDRVSPTFRALRNPNYRLYLAGSVVSNTGTWMQRVAQDWLVLQPARHRRHRARHHHRAPVPADAAALAVRRRDRRPVPQAAPAPAHPGRHGASPSLRARR